MEKHRAIPHGFMTVGEVVKKLNTTVRTLQYYDKEGILAPSAESEGGRRLYTDKDIVKLYQIMSLKYLGFSLTDIKNRMIFLDKPTDVAEMLTEHAATVRNKIADLSEALIAIEALKQEVLAMQSVDFKKYADIIVNLQHKNDMYWLLKHFDDDWLEHLRNRFDLDSGIAFRDKIICMQNEAIRLSENGISPNGEQGLSFAKEFWDMLMDYMGGDISLFPKVLKISEAVMNENDEWRQRSKMAESFISPAMEAYFTSIGFNPFKEEDK